MAGSSEPARREALARLLALNHQRYEEEVRSQKAEGGRKASGKKAKGKKAGKEQLGLL